MSNDAAREASAWLKTAKEAGSSDTKMAAAAVSIAISLDRIADALTAGPRPNDAEKTYTGPVRVPTEGESVTSRAAKVSSPFPRPSLLPDTHPSTIVDAAWVEETTRRTRANSEALLAASHARVASTPANDLENPELH